MALIVEDGSGMATAESYISVSAADDYLNKRNRDATWTTYSPEQKEGYLRAATEYLDAMCSWRGSVANEDQALGWPRFDACDKWDRLIANNVVPQLVKVATVEIASQGAIAQTGEQMIRSETVGPISVTYETTQDRTVGSALYQLAFDLVASLTDNRGGSIPVVRS